jgi:hypothetical protein
MKHLALALLLLAPQAAFASWLPLWYDIPARNNPQDPAVSRSSGAIAVTASAQHLPLAALAEAGWGFDGASSQGWAPDTAAGAGILAATASSARSHDGCCSLACACAFQGLTRSGRVAVDLSASPLSLAGRTVRAWLYVPAGLASGTARLEMVDSQGALIPGPAVSLTGSAGWLALKASPGAVGASVRGLALSISGVQEPFYGTVHLDSVSY